MELVWYRSAWPLAISAEPSPTATSAAEPRLFDPHVMRGSSVNEARERAHGISVG